jgi:protein TonB
MRFRIGLLAFLAWLVAGGAAAQDSVGSAFDVPSRALADSHNCAGYYPALSQRLSQSGSVLIGYDVSADGALTNVAVLQSSGFKGLDDAALLCVSQHWRNTPAMKHGVPVRSPGHRAIIQFTLSGSEAGLSMFRPYAMTAGRDKPGPVADIATADTGYSDMWEFLIWTLGPLAVIGWFVRWSRLFVFRRRDCPACDARNRGIVPFTLPGYCSTCGSKFAPDT